MNNLIKSINEFIKKAPKQKHIWEHENEPPKPPSNRQFGTTTRSQASQIPQTPVEEAARQATPKPGYHSPHDFVADYNESKRLGDKFNSWFGRKPRGTTTNSGSNPETGMVVSRKQPKNNVNVSRPDTLKLPKPTTPSTPSEPTQSTLGGGYGTKPSALKTGGPPPKQL